VKIVRDEMILKSVLGSLRFCVNYAFKNNFTGTISIGLKPLLYSPNPQEDFFSQIISMQVNQRQKALRKLSGLVD